MFQVCKYKKILYKRLWMWVIGSIYWMCVRRVSCHGHATLSGWSQIWYIICSYVDNLCEQFCMEVPPKIINKCYKWGHWIGLLDVCLKKCIIEIWIQHILSMKKKSIMRKMLKCLKFLDFIEFFRFWNIFFDFRDYQYFWYFHILIL